jgi:hypothetical protein
MRGVNAGEPVKAKRSRGMRARHDRRTRLATVYYRDDECSCVVLKPTCPTCGLRIERGESDYFVGAYLFNLIAVELILFVCVCGFVFLTWPNVPWDTLTYVAGALMLVGCVACYPFAKMTWLAVDLAIRPLSAEELRWHHEGGVEGDRELPHC